MLIFDIETEALPDERLFALADPYQPPEAPGDFDPSAVKYGNTKDEAKRADILAAAKAKHEAEVLGFQSTLPGHRKAWEFNIRDKAALSACTARVLAIGYLSVTDKTVDKIDGATYDGNEDDARESKLLANFWATFAKMISKSRSIIGVNIFEFDLPFLVRRSMLLDVAIPTAAFTRRGDRVNWHDSFIDLTTFWKLGQRMSPPSGSYSALAKAFGTPGKPDGVDGSMFAQLWKTDKAKAIEYLANDLKQPALWAKRMGIVQ